MDTRLRRLLADTRPLSVSPAYRRLWVGQALSGIGSMMTSVAVPVQVYELTRSSFAVGMLGLAFAVPVLALGLVGGSLADAVDRRRMALWCSVGQLAVSGLFAAQAVAGSRALWPLYALTVAQAGLMALGAPAQQALMPRLLPPELYAAGAALGHLTFQVSMMAGPLLAGVLVAAAGVQAAYLADVLTFAFALYGLSGLPPMPPEGGGTRPGLRGVAEGLRFLRGRTTLATVLLVDLNATVFAMPGALFPALAIDRFGGGARTVGLLYAAPAIGGLLAGALSGPATRMPRQGLGVLVGATIWGGSIAGLGLARSTWLGVALLAVAGGADMISVALRNAMMQEMTPDRLRGRVNAVNFVVGASGPYLGNVRAGAVAAAIGPGLSAATGGLACVAGVLGLALAVPSFARYSRPSSPG